jgi:hypothetical protein
MMPIVFIGPLFSALEGPSATAECSAATPLRWVCVGSDSKTMDRLCRLMPERAAGIIYKQMKSLLDN